MTDEERASILSREERALAARLAENREVSPTEIAAATNRSEDSVVKAIDRIRTKTRRAYATLLLSPFADELARELGDDERKALVALLDPDAVDEDDR